MTDKRDLIRELRRSRLERTLIHRWRDSVHEAREWALIVDSNGDVHIRELITDEIDNEHLIFVDWNGAETEELCAELLRVLLGNREAAQLIRRETEGAKAKADVDRWLSDLELGRQS